MQQRIARTTVAEWLGWAACGLSVLAALAVLLIPAGGTNRVQGAVVPFGIAAVSLAGNGFVWRRSLWGGAALFALGGVALAYAVVLALSVPLRLAVEGTCPLDLSNCPLGFDHPLTAAENFAVYGATVLGALALILLFAAVEARHVHRRRTNPERSIPNA